MKSSNKNSVFNIIFLNVSKPCRKADHLKIYFVQAIRYRKPTLHKKQDFEENDP